MTALYLDTDDLKKTLALSGTTFLDDELDSIALAASGGLDKALGRTFGKDTADVSRYYTALDPMRIRIDDLAELTTLKSDEDGDGTYEVTWAATDYVLEPLNAATDDEPYTTISVHPSGSYRFPTHYPKAVQVTGIFGWPATPWQIKEAATLICEQIVQRKHSMPMGFAISAEAVAYIARSDPQISFLLDGLGRRKLIA